MRYLFFLLVLLSACEVKVSTNAGNTTEQPVRNKSKIRNGIAVNTTGGVTVEQAFLTYVDNGAFVSDSNVTTINRPVKLHLLVKGWKATAGKVTLDAEQKITTNEGDLVLELKDMLKEANPIAENDAENLSFQFVITRLNKLFDYFLVEVAARNKEGAQEIKASFKVHVE